MNKDLNKPNAIDVKYTSVPKQDTLDPTKILNTTLYTIGQVANELGVKTHTVRYWTATYYDYLDITMCNTHRRYSQLDISKLKIIKNCIANKMGHQQIINALQNTEFNEDQLMEAIQGRQNQLNIQVVASALISDFEAKLKASNEALLKDIAAYVNNQGEALQHSLVDHVDKIVSDRLSSMSRTLQDGFDDMSSINTSLDKKLDTVASNVSKITTDDNDNADHIQELLSNIKQQQTNMNETMLDMKKTQEELSFRSITLEEYKKEFEQNNKSWFSKLFGKHK